jgi:uncharacterized protein (TIGR02328 family)
MRLWHQSLIKKLPRQQLLGQHREICALRGNGWGKKHATVDYVFTHPPEYLIAYHFCAMNEMKSRGYKVTKSWLNPLYRGKNCQPYNRTFIDMTLLTDVLKSDSFIYPEHNDAYLQECIENLKNKGIDITV